MTPRLLERHLRLPGTRNLRDVGGYPAGASRRTRWRTVLRTDALDRLPAASRSALLDLGLRCVVDLRWPEELVESPSVFATSDRVTYRSIPLLEDDPTPAHGMAATYRHIFDERAAQLAEVVRTLLAPEGLPVAIGCAAGKDRTGVVIALLLAAVGVPSDVIVADYELSGEALGGELADDPHLDDWRAQPSRVDCPGEYMLEALDHLDRHHGGASSLLLRNGLTEPELDRLVELLTEPTGGAGLGEAW